MALQVSREENSANTQVRRGMNDENTFVNRECQMAVAENDRIESSRRNDVDQTTDCKAFDEMWKYVKSDTTTLDTHVNSEIANFYRKRSIFMTGASGFVGKVIMITKISVSTGEVKFI